MLIDEGRQDRIPNREAQSTWHHRRKQWFVVIIFCVVLGGALAFGILPRLKQSSTVRAETAAQMAVLIVSVVHPGRSAPKQEIVLPANVQAYVSAPIFARTNGYLKQWYVDIGGHVKKGQLLAIIETRSSTSNCNRRAPRWRPQKPICVSPTQRQNATSI